MRPRLLDLFCCAGGAAKGYHDAGFEVVGVDNQPQPNYPYEFHQADALDFVAHNWREFDAIHASPPCQSYLNLGKVNLARGRGYEHPDLIAETRRLLVSTGLPYVVENVADARRQLRDPVQVCGTFFDLPLRRHRMFGIQPPALRDALPPRPIHVVQVYGMPVDRLDDPREMCEAIPPAYTEYMGAQLLGQLAVAA